jgi:glycerol-3-phosphate acyltransferase PlsY
MMPIFARVAIVMVSSYLIGAIPASFIMGKLVRGIDLREHGSGNLGAANTFRVLGPGAAIPVLLFDIGKGFVAVWYLSKLGEGNVWIWIAMLAAVMVVIGHNYSIFLRFSGGKGVGTTAGAFLALAPQALAICIGIWIVVLLTTRIVSLASMIAAVLLPISILLSDELFGSTTHALVLTLSILVAILVIYKHRPNIQRLREGKEKKIF